MGITNKPFQSFQTKKASCTGQKEQAAGDADTLDCVPHHNSDKAVKQQWRGDRYRPAQRICVDESNKHPAGSWLLSCQRTACCWSAIPPHSRAGTQSALLSWLLAGRRWVGTGKGGLGGVWGVGALSPGRCCRVVKSEQPVPQAIVSSGKRARFSRGSL